MRREVAKLRLLLQQYGVLAGQAQLFCSDQAGRAGRVVLLSTSNAGASRYWRGAGACCSVCAGMQLCQPWQQQQQPWEPPAMTMSAAGHCCWCCLLCCLLAGPGLLERVSAVLGSKTSALLTPLELELPGDGVKVMGCAAACSKRRQRWAAVAADGRMACSSSSSGRSASTSRVSQPSCCCRVRTHRLQAGVSRRRGRQGR